MPELPEVESIRLQLEKFLVGHKIENVLVANPKIFNENPKNLIGAKFIAIRRFGKVLVMDLDNDLSLVAHVKLTGQFIYRGLNLKKSPSLSKKVTGGLGGKHTHVIFELNRGAKLYYNDVRRFGWIKAVKTKDLKKENKFIANLGPEPLKDLTLAKFKEILGKTRRAVKVVLMDQSKIGGIGNIYANDALWLSKISPKRPANSISEVETKKLFNAVEKVLKTGLKYGGASELAFVRPDGTEGDYQSHSLVYGRTGEMCKSCKKEKIKKEMLGGRGTYFCEKCQS